jgi:hypothetical protein
LKIGQAERPASIIQLFQLRHEAERVMIMFEQGFERLIPADVFPFQVDQWSAKRPSGKKVEKASHVIDPLRAESEPLSSHPAIF